MATPPSQPTIHEPSDAQYGLFHWIHFGGDGCNVWNKDDVDDKTVREIITRCAKVHQTSQRVNDPIGLKVGIGFGKQFLERILKLKIMTENNEVAKIQIAKEAIQKEFNEVIPKLDYKERIVEEQGSFKLPDTGGDVFIHAKGNSVGTLYEFLHLFLDSLDSHRLNIDTENTSITQGFTYQNHRDISGYMYGTTNPITHDERRIAAVEVNTGGSFAMTQKWKHDMSKIKVVRPSHETVDRQNRCIGIERDNGKVLPPNQRPGRAHLTLMGKAQGDRRIVRQSLPYAQDNGTTGLFFLAYANDTNVFGDIMDTMIAGEGDLLFEMSENTRGAYWYFPGMTSLNKLHDATKHSE